MLFLRQRTPFYFYFFIFLTRFLSSQKDTSIVQEVSGISLCLPHHSGINLQLHVHHTWFSNVESWSTTSVSSFFFWNSILHWPGDCQIGKTHQLVSFRDHCVCGYPELGYQEDITMPHFIYIASGDWSQVIVLSRWAIYQQCWLIFLLQIGYDPTTEVKCLDAISFVNSSRNGVCFLKYDVTRSK